MVKTEATIVINRPVEQVFAYTIASENDAQWQVGVVSVEDTSEGPMGVGFTFTQVVQFLGQTLEIPFEITAFDTNARFGFKSTGGPIPVTGEFRYESVPGGTKFSMLLEGEPGGLFRLAEPLVARSTQRQWETNLANLKDILEA